MADASKTPASRTGKTLSSNLRFGWTTGTCATAAVNAAYMALVTGQFPEKVSVVTPSGKQADLDVSFTREPGGHEADRWRMAGIIKDAGDDPDVTHGALICARVSAARQGDGVIFMGGDGVGIVTKPGLPIEVGEPAINPVPRQMMREMITTLAGRLNGPRDVVIEISVPDGADIALRTWNPRLGIEGGISILGTTGVVRPFSCSAWIASIHRGIDVARANALPHVMGSTGATSENFARSRYDLPDIACLDMGDFVGGMLKYLRGNPVPSLTIAGGAGKMVKFAQGAVDLHSARSQVDFDLLATLASDHDIDPEPVRRANTVLEVMSNLKGGDRDKLANAIADGALNTATKLLKGADIALEILVVSRDGQLLGQAGCLQGRAQ
ncbi:MAG: cobalt-precorrin-5B (C(1))-methyltransferase [Alphaproteobacteria bacterium]